MHVHKKDPTFPFSVIYPVIPIPCLIGLLSARLIKEDVIEMPAEGPSFGTAPSGKCK